MSKFAEKVAIVTGAGSGMGLQVAIDLAAQGAKVVISGRTQSKLDKAVQLITEKGGEVTAFAGDVGIDADNKALVEAAVSKYGRLDLMFVNAGTYTGAPFAELTDEVITSLLDTNLKSVIYAFKYGLPAIKESGGKGSIVVNTSCMGSVVTANPGFQTGAVYAATKSAADTLVKYAAIDGASHGTRVNSIAPGIVVTDIFGGMDSDGINGFAAPVQLVGRAGKPSEISAFVLFLLSDAASFVTGSVHMADGGWALKA